jgi:hypothetical protein
MSLRNDARYVPVRRATAPVGAAAYAPSLAGLSLRAAPSRRAPTPARTGADADDDDDDEVALSGDAAAAAAAAAAAVMAADDDDAATEGEEGMLTEVDAVEVVDEAELNNQMEVANKAIADAELAMLQAEIAISAAGTQAATTEKGLKDNALKSAKDTEQAVKAYEDLHLEEKRLKAEKLQAEAGEKNEENTATITRTKARLAEIKKTKPDAKLAMDTLLQRLKAEVAAAALELTNAKGEEAALKKALGEKSAAAKAAAKALADKNKLIAQQMAAADRAAQARVKKEAADAAAAAKAQKQGVANEKRRVREEAAAEREAEREAKRQRKEQAAALEAEKQKKLAESLAADEEKHRADEREIMCESFMCQMHELRERLGNIGDEATEIMDNIDKEDGCDEHIDDDEIEWYKEITDHAVRVQKILETMKERGGGWNEEYHKQFLEECDENPENDPNAEAGGDKDNDELSGDDEDQTDKYPDTFRRDGDFSHDDPSVPGYQPPDPEDDEYRESRKWVMGDKKILNSYTAELDKAHAAAEAEKERQQRAQGTYKPHAAAKVLMKKEEP